MLFRSTESHQVEAVFVCERGRGLEGQAGEKPSVFPRQVCVLVIRLVELTWQSGVARAPELPALARSLPGA